MRTFPEASRPARTSTSRRTTGCRSTNSTWGVHEREPARLQAASAAPASPVRAAADSVPAGRAGRPVSQAPPLPGPVTATDPFDDLDELDAAADDWWQHALADVPPEIRRQVEADAARMLADADRRERLGRPRHPGVLARSTRARQPASEDALPVDPLADDELVALVAEPPPWHEA